MNALFYIMSAVEQTGFDIIPLLSVAIPSLIATIGTVIGAHYLRRTTRERNAIDQNVASDVNETNAFDIVTNKLFKLNEEQASRLKTLEDKVEGLEDALEAKDVTIASLRSDLDQSVGIAQQLALYIKRLLAHWPADSGAPPAPNPPIDWQKHL